MDSVASDLLLLITNLSQVKKRDLIISLFIDGLNDIFKGHHFLWIENPIDNSYTLPVCTSITSYGYVSFDEEFKKQNAHFILFQNTVQLLAVFIDQIEQEEMLSDQAKHLQYIVDQQIIHYINKQDELNEINEEFTVINEELTETNKTLFKINEQLNIEIKERLLSEESIRQSEQLFSNIFYNSPVAISITSRDDGKIVDVNEAFLHDLEFSRDEVVGKSIIELGVFYDASYREKLIGNLIKDGFVTGFECPFKTKTGRIMYGIMSMSFIQYKGKPHQLTTVIDITQRKQAELKIHYSERLLNESQRVSGIGSYVLDIIKGYWSGSVMLDEMFGLLPTDDHSIQGWVALIHPEDREMMDNYLAVEVIGKKNRFDKTYRILPKKTNKFIWVHGIGELEFDTTGSPIKMTGTIQDITYRVDAEEKLRILNRAIDQSPDSILITNTKAEIEYVNPIIEKITGYSKDELIGHKPNILSSGQTPIEVYKQLWGTIKSGNIWQGEFQNKKKNGELFWESATISPVINNEGKISHYLAIKEDITEQKRLTQELIQAKEKAEESDRLKTSFLANMSHEIRTPMNSIMGFASLLPDEDCKELISQYARIIVQNSEQLVHIIDDIVLYSRLQTRLLSLYPSEFNAFSLLSDIIKSFDLPQYNKGIELIIEPGLKQDLTIKTDYEKLRQIITNLVSNAFKYTKSGYISMGVKNMGSKVLFTIQDTGIGIPLTEQDKIFERFYRATNIDKGAISGTGLGLSIVKELVGLLLGEIWVESQVDKGTTFYISLPHI